MALNYFKYQLLGERHLPNEAQTEDVLTALSVIGMNETFDPRTWRRWFGKDARRARGDSIHALDKTAAKLPSINLQVGLHDVKPSCEFFSEMIEGGLCKELLEPTASKRPMYPLLQKADEYYPSSAWHLHLDAIEAVALADANGDVDWETVKAIAAHRVQSILHSRWNPRDGSIYPTLTSNFRVEWDQANDSKKEHIRKDLERMTPNTFRHLMTIPAAPTWSQINVEIDVGPAQVHRLLFSMCADEDFLVVDRFDAWALDLATAALAMLAIALTDRYNTLGAKVGPEFLYWDVFEMLFFCEEECEDFVFESLHHAMECTGDHLSQRSFDLFLLAGTRYRNALTQIGVSYHDVLNLTSRCWAKHPMVYRGVNRSKSWQ